MFLASYFPPFVGSELNLILSTSTILSLELRYYNLLVSKMLLLIIFISIILSYIRLSMSYTLNDFFDVRTV